MSTTTPQGFRPVNEVRDAKSSRRARQAFYTPLALVQSLVEWANLYPSARTLEPSAGDGRIVHAMIECGVERVDACEVDATMAERCAGLGATVVGDDFLKYAPGQVYDRIVMNPPFTRGTADRHIQYAYSLLAPGGHLVSVAPTTTKESLCNGELVLPDCDYADVEDLDAGLFKEFGTNIETVLVSLSRKPAFTPEPVLGFSNSATCNAVLTIETDRELFGKSRRLDTARAFEDAFARNIAESGGSRYGVDWTEVANHFIAKRAENDPVVVAKRVRKRRVSAKVKSPSLSEVA